MVEEGVWRGRGEVSKWQRGSLFLFVFRWIRITPVSFSSFLALFSHPFLPLLFGSLLVFQVLQHVSFFRRSPRRPFFLALQPVKLLFSFSIFFPTCNELIQPRILTEPRFYAIPKDIRRNSDCFSLFRSLRSVVPFLAGWYLRGPDILLEIILRF